MFRLVLFLLLAGSHSLAQSPDAALQRYVQDGDRALAEGRYADAEQAYEKVRQLAPGTAEVYAKLGVTTRNDAVERARVLGLLARPSES